ncbi:MAG: hypothetical protein DRO11_04685 [Methanobacteriota archaeon]|nr:MAG: hypothetical protein DRO11_04685 [Euryarchaeota archaeon]
MGFSSPPAPVKISVRLDSKTWDIVTDLQHNFGASNAADVVNSALRYFIFHNNGIARVRPPSKNKKTHIIQIRVPAQMVKIMDTLIKNEMKKPLDQRLFSTRSDLIRTAVWYYKAEQTCLGICSSCPHLIREPLSVEELLQIRAFPDDPDGAFFIPAFKVRCGAPEKCPFGPDLNLPALLQHFCDYKREKRSYNNQNQ